MSSLSTHVLDAVRGAPAAGVLVALQGPATSGWIAMAEAVTDGDGRIGELAADLVQGGYRLVFGTGDYFARLGSGCFYPEVVISFTITDERHYHVPLLLSPYAYSTYRGS